LDGIAGQPAHFYTLQKAKKIPDCAISGISFMDAKDLYLKLKGQCKAESFATYTKRGVGTLSATK
tara:strand:- start:112 stop:306 length:195 start_codon:yes stop_codon:yes gene_type:complete